MSGFVVEDPGLRTTVQDLGRPGLAHLGVPRSGAADMFSHRLANALVGNLPSAATLETTLVGPKLRFRIDAIVALAGAPVNAKLDDAAVAFGSACSVRAGQLLDVGKAVDGLRTYIAIAGGVDALPILGSRSTDTLSGLGPAPLAAGDEFDVGERDHVQAAELPSAPMSRSDEPIRVLPGPDDEWFASDALERLCSQPFEVSPRSDRVGARLIGPALERARAGEAPTAGMVLGAIQVPPDGAPIVLLADHAVTGGYPVLAVVASADVRRVAQARPGAVLRFAIDSGGVGVERRARAGGQGRS